MIKHYDCPTMHIQDIPKNEDEFGKGHQSVAEAITELITTTQPGHTIGLEGEWGSGKSTIIHLIQEKLKDQKDFLVHVFDAWGHQGDPLRRVFLLRLLESAKPWIDNKDEYKRLTTDIKGLAGTSNLGSGDQKIMWFWVPLFLLLTILPIGVNLIVREINNITLKFDANHHLNPHFIIGTTIILLFLVLLIVVRILYNKDSSKYGLSILNIIPQKQKEMITIDPTSIEFENCFKDIILKSLTDNQRKLVIVIDNIDRIEPQFARSILDSLQTFIEKDKVTCEVFDNVWVIIPYDYKSITKIWNPNNSPELKEFADAFLHKRFQSFFQTPPVINSDWKKFFLDKLEKAFPKHVEEKEQLLSVFEIFNLYGRKNKNVNPRDIIRFINRLGSFHIIWQDKISLEHISSYICEVLYGWDPQSQGDPNQIIEQILLKDPIPVEIKRNYLALFYNQEPDDAFQVHFEKKIQKYLTSENYQEILNFHKICADGFWFCFDEIDLNFFAMQNGISQLCFINQVLETLPIEQYLQNRIGKKLLKSCAYVEDWSELSVQNIIHLRDFFTNLPFNQVQIIFQSFSKINSIIETLKIEKVAIEGEQSKLANWVDSVHRFLDIFVDHPDIEKLHMVLPFNEISIYDFLSVIHKKSGYSEKLGHYSSGLTPEILINSEKERISKNSLDEVDLFVYTDFPVLGINLSWIEIVAAITEKINEIDSSNTQIEFLIPFLLMLSETETDALKALEIFSQSPQIYKLLNDYKESPDEISLLLYIIFNHSNGQIVPVGGVVPTSQPGVNFLSLILNNPENHIGILALYANRVIQYGEPNEFFTGLTYTNLTKFLLEVLRILIVQDGFRNSLSYDTIFVNWRDIKKVTDNPLYENILERLDSSFDEFVKRAFREDEIDLYIDLIPVLSNSNKRELKTWLTSYFTHISEEDWDTYLINNVKIITLLSNANSKLGPIRLGFQFTTSIERLIQKIIDDDTIPEAFLSDWHNLKLSYRDSTLFVTSMQRIIKFLIDSPRNCSEKLFPYFGDDLINIDVLTCHKEIVPNLFSRIVRDDDIIGIKWLALVFNKYPNLLSAFHRRSENHELKVRIFEKSENSENQEIRDHLIKIIGETKWRKPKSMSAE